MYKLYIINMTDTLQDEVPRFNSIISSSHNFTTFNPEQHFSEYHYYETYDPNKQYNKNEFETNFNKGMHTYEYELHIIYNINDDDVKQFVVATEKLSDAEITKLAKYCSCAYCEANFIKKQFICACCVGCLKSHFPQQYVINKAREKMNVPANDKSTLSFFSFFNY